MADAVRFTWGSGSTTRLYYPGLAGNYFGDISLGQLKFSRRDPAVQFNWLLGPPGLGFKANKFSVRWTGFIRAPANGDYTFYTVSDDGVKLYVRDMAAPLIDDWAGHTAHEVNKTVTLTAGETTPIKIEYFDNTGAAKMVLKWSGPGFGKGIVPTSVLWTL